MQHTGPAELVAEDKDSVMTGLCHFMPPTLGLSWW